MAVAVVAEAPSGGYSYSGGGGGYSGGLSGGGGGYTAVSSGYTTSEGQNVDPALLEQVRQILLKEEQSSSSSSGFSSGGISSSYGAPSSQYGVPSSSYGAPSYSARVVGIDLEGIKQAIQVIESQSGLGITSHLLESRFWPNEFTRRTFPLVLTIFYTILTFKGSFQTVLSSDHRNASRSHLRHGHLLIQLTCKLFSFQEHMFRKLSGFFC